MGGFDQHLKSSVLDELHKQITDRTIEIQTEYIVDDRIKNNYPNFNLKFSADAINKVIDQFQDYKTHPDLSFENFLCSFNGVSQVGRKLLVSILHKFGYFDPRYCSKNFSFSQSELSGHITEYVSNEDRFYSKFFFSDDNNFYNSIYTFGHNRFDHAKNIYVLEKPLTQSFLHLISDTLATTYFPFYGEKFLYSVVTRGLFLSYAQPGWHNDLEKYYGFRKYDRIFDYTFDNIQNPVKRLVELITMISKFKNLSSDDWRDLYLLQYEEIEYNYNHYYSGNYLQYLKKIK